MLAACASIVASASLWSSPVAAHPSVVDAPAPVRFTTDTAPLTDAAGAIWQARPAELDTDKRSTRLLGKDVRGTTDDRLYQVNAWGATKWTIPVTVSGRYRVRLLAAEDTFTEAGRRVFDVTAEGNTVASAVDLVAAAGFGTAHDITFETQVVDDRLDLGFVRKVDMPLIAAVEVTWVPPAQTEDGHVRMVAGPAAVRDAAGATWSPAFGYTGPYRTSTALAGAAIGGTDDDELYRTSTWGMTGWKTPVRSPGTYTVRLLTTEGRWTAVGQRLFDVTAEGRPALEAVDIYKSSGIKSAFAPQFQVEVTDGVLDLGFVATKDQATVSAIEVIPATATPTPPTGPPVVVDDGTDEEESGPVERAIFTSRMVARPTAYTDLEGHRWSRWSATLGSWNATTKLTGDVGGTTDDDLYRANVWGVKGYTLPVPESSTYRVRLLMAEDSFFSAGKRVFDIAAEGAVRESGVDVAARVGHGVAHDVTFDVEVTDGELDLTFLRKIDEPLVSAIEVTSTNPVLVPEAAPHRLVKLAPDSFFTTPVADAPVAENSAAVSSWLTSQVSSRYGGIAAFSAYHFNIAFYPVPAGVRRVTVDYSCGPTPPPSLYDGPGYFLDVPVPDTAVTSQGTDGAMTIYDAKTDQMWNFWQMKYSATTKRWSACWGGRIDQVSKNQGVFPSGFGASASGIAVTPGIVSLEDVKRGRIDHALVLSVPGPAAGRFSWPANRTDGTSSDPAAVMEGQRLRLDPSLDLDTLNLTPVGRLVAEAAQKYGFVVTDNGGSVAVSTEAGDHEAVLTGANPWDTYVARRDWEVMKNFPWSKVQALPVDYGRPSSP